MQAAECTREKSFLNYDLRPASPFNGAEITQEQVNNMSPSDVAKYWASGEGGSLYFGADSKMSKIFSDGKGAKTFESFLRQKYGGTLSSGDNVSNFDYKFTWSRALSTSNAAEHAVGSWENGVAFVGETDVLFTVYNTMGANSLFFGRQFGEIGITPIGDRPGDLHMSIDWTRPRETP